MLLQISHFTKRRQIHIDEKPYIVFQSISILIKYQIIHTYKCNVYSSLIKTQSTINSGEVILERESTNPKKAAKPFIKDEIFLSTRKIITRRNPMKIVKPNETKNCKQ